MARVVRAEFGEFGDRNSLAVECDGGREIT